MATLWQIWPTWLLPRGNRSKRQVPLERPSDSTRRRGLGRRWSASAHFFRPLGPHSRFDPDCWSGQLAATSPTFEEVDSLRRPRAVTWHGAGPQTLEDSVRVRAHVLVGPEVEVPPHRLKVFRATQRFDLGGELDGLIGSRHAYSRLLHSLRPASGG